MVISLDDVATRAVKEALNPKNIHDCGLGLYKSHVDAGNGGCKVDFSDDGGFLCLDITVVSAQVH